MSTKQERYREKQRRQARRQPQRANPKGESRKAKMRRRKINPKWGGKSHTFEVEITVEKGTRLVSQVRASSPKDAAMLALHLNRDFIIYRIGVAGRSAVKVTHEHRGVVLDKKMHLPCPIIFVPKPERKPTGGGADKSLMGMLGVVLRNARARSAAKQEQREAIMDIEKHKVEGKTGLPSFPGK